ncbi:uncharacterized protein LOC123511111 [Portunus trituberculatus]|uniref:uncharacterized protein LOC123511111 n=1 Tax=Portunus trituberculatus TaxID=210409 RepID=UPI001E1D0561|nr:uncharacterized protein LOC123511111 [Portunus trituberculatus]
MGKNTYLAHDKIAQIIALKESGLQTKDIVAQLGVSERSVRRWVARFNQQASRDTPTHERRPGPSRNTSDCCRNIVKRVLESNPRISARKIKEENPRLLGDVSVRMASRLIAELGYSNHRTLKKPLLIRTHKVNRVQFARKYRAWDEKWLTAFEDTEAIVFQQDGAKPHTAKSVTHGLRDCEVQFIDDWPGNSPDLNPIENLWQIMKRDLQGKDESSVPKLKREIRASWDWCSTPSYSCMRIPPIPAGFA